MQLTSIITTATAAAATLPPQPPWPILLISFLGFLSLLNQSLSLLKWVFTRHIRPPKNLTKTYGSWAIITGATDGIGKAFAYQLAQKGLNLILISRNPTKLQNVSTQIKTQFPNTRIKVVAFDFTESFDLYGWFTRRLEETMKGLDVGVLINNAGMSYPSAMYFDEVDENVWMDIVRVNVESSSWVMKCVLKRMVERKKKGLIVNIGSGASVVVPSHPLSAIYASTKAYIDKLSRCLYVEYKQFGIDVQCQVPLYVATKLVSKIASIEKTSMFIPSPEDYAKAAVRLVGYEPRCTPYWAHSLQWFLVQFLPDSLVDAWRLSIGIRRREKFNQQLSSRCEKI